jgi:HEPN domain-containing protein
VKPPEEVKLEFTRQWVRKAEADFKAALLLLSAGDDYLFQSAFHAQQSAEKYIKRITAAVLEGARVTLASFAFLRDFALGIVFRAKAQRPAKTLRQTTMEIEERV